MFSDEFKTNATFARYENHSTQNKYVIYIKWSVFPRLITGLSKLPLWIHFPCITFYTLLALFHLMKPFEIVADLCTARTVQDPDCDEILVMQTAG